MTRRRALVVHTRMPAPDRDSGSQDIDNTIRVLLDEGWSVTFLSREEEGVAETRHADRLRRLGVATYAGFSWAEEVLRTGGFDIAVIGFWDPAAALLPLIHRHAPRTRVIVNSMDVHFLRLARLAFSQGRSLDATFGDAAARELSTYALADAVLAVSDKERDLLADFLGADRVFTLSLAEDVRRSPHPLEERRGLVFVGNFRHVPNQEAAEHLSHEVLPLLDPELLARHPLTLLGNWLEEARLDLDRDAPGLNVVGWVPSVQPYVERARLSAVPLLHGAGVKRKVIQSMMAGTPVVTTAIGAEGLDLVQGVHALVGADAADLAAGITRALTDDALWHRLAEAGAEHVDARHGRDRMRGQLVDILDRVLSRPARGAPGHAPSSRGRAATARHRAADAVRARLLPLTERGTTVLVVSGGDEDLVDLGVQPCWPFPQGRDGGWAGFEPADGRAAVNHLEAQRTRGARSFVLPRAAFGWRTRFPELFDHLDATARRIHDDEHVLVWDLLPTPTLVDASTVAGIRVSVLGTHAADRTGPAPSLVEELGRSDHLVIDQRWRSADEEPAEVPGPEVADVVVHVRDDAVLPRRFLDDLVATQLALGVDRIQPAHVAGPDAGPPVTERLRGTIAREVDGPTPLPVLAVRAGAEPDGPVALADRVTVGLRRDRVGRLADPVTGSEVRRLWVEGADGRPTAVTRPEPATPPRVSVLIATYERGLLLRDCLLSFAAQTLDRSAFEVVVVDDGSQDPVLDQLVEELEDRLQIVGVRIDHAGRSAAKNLCVLLARAPVVLFFDDDDQAAPDLLERHLARHDATAADDDGLAVLGHTDWADGVTPTPLMRYVTEVARLMFAYERLEHGQQLDWRGFWEGRISCSRRLLLAHGLHDQRLDYSIDVELAWRLAPHGLRVVYDATARSVMARPLEVDDFTRRSQAKGTAHAVIATLHPGTRIARSVLPAGVEPYRQDEQAPLAALRRRVLAIERAPGPPDDAALAELHQGYEQLFRRFHARGVAEATEGSFAMTSKPTTVQPFEGTDPDLVHDGTPADAPTVPALTVTIPVWSTTPELAAMARRTIERIWEVSRIPTEVVVIDNGSPHEVPLPAKVYRYPENKGVATGWNTGIRLATAPVVCVMNSDCNVEPGWDEALYEAASSERMVAFPYTDHCDGRGFTTPDQGGTAGWCFMLSKALYDEVGVFDEWFNPAFCEDTDYWHRAWELGVRLSPVPAARVIHARRTTASTRANVDWLLQGHRYKYGWKHGVDPHRAPPYYDREIVEYRGSFEAPPGPS